jgi:hypothetical protein
VYAWVLARQDLARMRRGRVDRRGGRDVRAAAQLGAGVAAVAVGALAAWGVLLLLAK